MAQFSGNQMKFLNAVVSGTGLHPGVVAAWMAAEEPVGAQSGYRGTQDWLNVGITDSGPRGQNNSVWADPVKAGQATAAWMKGTWNDPGFGHSAPGIRAIVGAARRSPQAQIAAIQHSGWATSGYSDLPGLFGTYGNTKASGITVPGMVTQKPPNQRASTTTTTSGGGTDWASAGIQAFLQAAGKPINTSGKVSVSNPLSQLVSNAASGLYNSPTTTTNTIKLPAAAQALGHNSPQLPVMPGQGNINPLGHGWTIGRRDQGVDANAAPGTPIRAINDSKVVNIVPNWYSGQPLVLMQLTSGPDRGKYWYVAEQINHGLRQGQTLRRGQTVATYAHNGTGIEIGWGSPATTHFTLATAPGHGGYSEGRVTPEASDFLNRILSIKN